ncbi:MAG: response regulator receiver modulated metal dependent phosphohydrolase [Fibrobacteres bacterium]|nr:response regulator receiver modulated metal dependent phosphohydrolase [Fibrobacterota bacterium]
MEKILFLDDEQNVLNALRRVFKDEDHSVILTTSPEEARERLSKERIAVAVSDQRMPTLTGIQFLEEVKKASPETVRILLTGHADMNIAMEAINRGSVFRFLLKPWDDDELRAVLKQAAAHYALVTENIRLTELTFRQNQELQGLNENLENKVRERTQEVEELNKRLEKSFLGSVRVMAGLAEVHSAVIGSHSRRVAALSKGMAKKMGLSREEAVQVEVAALLHDVGKTMLPSEVLNKAEHALKPEERERLKRHPVMGEALVRMVPNMETAARLVRHHHERFYGGGFPDRLKGQEIPLGSRIIAVADAYDNALNIRSEYQANLPERIFQQMVARSPGEFDPEVLEALGLFLREGDRIAQEASELEIKDRDLKAGMRLSRDVRNTQGVLLIPAGTVVTEEIVRTLQDYPEASRSLDGIHIFRNQGEPKPQTNP